MTATMDNSSRVMEQLISSCYRAQEHFRTAAEAVDDSSLKRLFEIYAQQRTRFAQELREHLTGSPPAPDSESEAGEKAAGTQDFLRHCLDTEAQTLQLYKEALAERALPTRTQFLISSQLALMERAHERVSSLARKPDASGALAGRSFIAQDV